MGHTRWGVHPIVHGGEKEQLLHCKIMNTPDLFTPIRLGAIEALQAMAPPDLQKVLAARALSESDEDVLQALNC